MWLSKYWVAQYSTHRAFGANIGSDNFFEDVQICFPFMVTTGTSVVLESGAKLETHVILSNGDIAVDVHSEQWGHCC